jgi:lysophospholipase L1-like esterase
MKNWVGNAIVTVVSCAIAFVGIEAGLRIWGPDVLALGNQYVFYKFDPVLGWVNMPNTSGQFSRLEFSYEVDINDRGMRDRPVGPKEPGTVRVAMLGDSFVWGVGAAYGERFTEVMERLDPKLDVLNFGVSGYSPVQYLLEIDNVLQLKPDYVVVALCLGNDLSDNVQSNPYAHAKPYARLTPDGKSYEIAGYPLPDASPIGPALTAAGSTSRIVGLFRMWLQQRQQARQEVAPIDYKILYAPPASLTPQERRQAESMFEIDAMLLNDINKKVEASLGPGRFSVLLAPTKYEYNMIPNSRPGADPEAVADRVLADLKLSGIPAIDGRDVITPDDFWRNDGHWRPEGHEKIGELVTKYFAAATPLPGG